MTIIKKQAEIVWESGDLSALHKMTADEKQVAECEKQIRKCVEQRQKYYEQFIQSEIEYGTFTELKDECTAQIDKLNNRLTIYRQTKLINQENKKILMLAKEALSETANPQDIVNALVEKVYTFPNNHIEIHWKFVNFTVRNEQTQQRGQK